MNRNASHLTALPQLLKQASHRGGVHKIKNFNTFVRLYCFRHLADLSLKLARADTQVYITMTVFAPSSSRNTTNPDLMKCLIYLHVESEFTSNLMQTITLCKRFIAPALVSTCILLRPYSSKSVPGCALTFLCQHRVAPLLVCGNNLSL